MNFYAKEVCYVGLLVSEEGVKMNPKDHEAVQTLNCKTSQTVRDIRQLLRFLSYYGTYVQDFSRIAKPVRHASVKTEHPNLPRGKVLYQNQNGKFSMGIGHAHCQPAEPSSLELLALKWAICDKFRDYLFYAPHFTIFTDNNLLTYVFSTVKLNAVGH